VRLAIQSLVKLDSSTKPGRDTRLQAHEWGDSVLGRRQAADQLGGLKREELGNLQLMMASSACHVNFFEAFALEKSPLTAMYRIDDVAVLSFCERRKAE